VYSVSGGGAVGGPGNDYPGGGGIQIACLYCSGLFTGTADAAEYARVRPPDHDGYLTLGEAKWQWQHGKGRPVTADAHKLELSGLRVSDFPQGPGSTLNIQLAIGGIS
jgi:hypothetical protein